MQDACKHHPKNKMSITIDLGWEKFYKLAIYTEKYGEILEASHDYYVTLLRSDLVNSVQR